MKSTFTAQEVAQIKKLLQEAASEPPEMIPIEALIGNLRDEIATLRRDGISDDQIAMVITEGAGATVTGEQVTQFFARER
ncbi:MAG: hypothetical protein ABI216_13345 [Devosia sp.]